MSHVVRSGLNILIGGGFLFLVIPLSGCQPTVSPALIDTGRPELTEHRLSPEGKVIDRMGEYWLKKVEEFRQDNSNHPPGGCVLIGDSLTEQFPVAKMFPGLPVVNRGISGDKIGGYKFYGVVDRLDVSLADLKPRKAFLMIGINDIVYWDVPPEEMRKGYDRLLRRMKKKCPKAEIYVETLLPVTGEFARHIPEILQFNDYVRHLAPKRGVRLIDTFPRFVDERGELRAEYTNDGLHLTEKGYETWRDILLSYVNAP